MSGSKPYLVANVGTNVGDKRFEEGQHISVSLLTEKQRHHLVREGYATDPNKPEPETTEPEPVMPEPVVVPEKEV